MFAHFTARWCLSLLVVACLACHSTQHHSTSAAPQETSSANDFDLSKFEVHEGLLRTYFDRGANRLLVELPAPQGHEQVCIELLAMAGLSRGLGSNDVGLDRGLLGEAHIVHVRRLGKLVRFEQPNTRYMVHSEEPAQRRAAEESFAAGVLFGTTAEHVFDDGRALVDLSKWMLSDLMDVVGSLSRSGQGQFALSSERSAVELADCHVFPENLEFESTLTFTSNTPGPEVFATAAEASAPSLRQHLSLVAMPKPGFVPREHDPRTGAFAVTQVQLDAPLHTSTQKAWAVRHRLTRKANGQPEPLTYYVDRGAPEPVRSALLDGARWWAQAFEAAGWPDTFRVELLPEDVHPLDSRYHVIQWVHRRTRGWSYGHSVIDPRSGEIVKAHVSLGALRVRQDILLFEGLLGTAESGTGAANDPVQLALARLRQLAAHEVGHTLGLLHNFAASTYDDRASVMDYPVARVQLDAKQRFDLSAAYGGGIGSWDREAVRDLYAEAPAGHDLAELRREWYSAAREAGHVLLSDVDARPASAADARAALWDNGPDAVASLQHALHVRQLALKRFDVNRLQPDRPRAQLQEVLVPLALHHRYAVDRAAKLIGGRQVDHVLVGSDAELIQVTPADEQRAALTVLLEAVDPNVLRLPQELLALLSPRMPTGKLHRELFPTANSPHVDPLSIAALLADQVLGGILQAQRQNRVAQQHDLDAQQLSVKEVMQEIASKAIEQAWTEAKPSRRAIRRVLLEQTVNALRALSTQRTASRFVRAQAEAALVNLAGFLEAAPSKTDSQHLAHARALAADIRRELDRPRSERAREPDAPNAPPGSPIGSGLLSLQLGCNFELF